MLDPGHGGHDPGVRGNGVNEAELVLDVSLRLKKLLENQPGMEVVMTRDTDVFIPLDQRTAIANREGADLFLSIHANASRNIKARGVETYFLNFAANPEAEAVAARENSASGQTMHRLPDIVRAITLNNKIDESRDFADTVQKAMVRTLSTRNRELQDRGVKQAPFVVLIGAGMPSVLAEISFVSHKQEGRAAQDLRLSPADRRSALRRDRQSIRSLSRRERRSRRGRIEVARSRAFRLAGGMDLLRGNAERLGVGHRLEVVAGAEELDPDQRPAEDRAEHDRREQQRADQAERADEHVDDGRRLDRLLDDADDDRISGLHDCPALRLSAEVAFLL